MGPALQFLELEGEHQPGTGVATLTADELIPHHNLPSNVPSPCSWTQQGGGEGQVQHLPHDPGQTA